MADDGNDTNEAEDSRLLPDVPIRNTSSHLLDISPIVHETDDSITIRRPVHYQSIINNGQQPVLGNRAQATVNRYKYYTKLASHSGSTMLMPNHVVPSEYFLVLPVRQADGTQSSIITIFSIWNTMVGTSLLSMPWAIERCGFASGIVILFVMFSLTLYTAYRVLQSPQSIEGSVGALEFSDVCNFYLGAVG
ncbi:Sodium-coupled neutral amino acid transporter 9 [Lamellibrachia satsuma]|nr:Sodium-coupled neutral amino acid transporter 9 [Lamellibrachia satsuma]